VPASATPPGKNGKLVWQREAKSGGQLFVAEADGGGARRVFAGGAGRGEFEGTFSPTDPDVVLFSRYGKAPFSENIFSGSLSSGAATLIVGASSADIAPTISPDGTKLAYFGVPKPAGKFNPDVPPPPERIHVANVDGSGDKAITAAKQRSFDPDWSPDGTRIVFDQSRMVGHTFQNRIAVMDADGGNVRTLTAFGGPDEINPKWMPDGQSIVYEQLRDKPRRSDILAIGPTGGVPRKILATAAFETNPIPSPDGKRILFTGDRDNRGKDRLTPNFELYTMAVDGTDIVRLTNNKVPDLFPDWQRLP
jgi:Tol biopolymer transport system component